jgi:glutamine synthetase
MSATALEEVVDDRGRDEQVAELAARLGERGIKHVYCQFTSIPGIVQGKIVPARRFEDYARKGAKFHLSVTAGVTVNRRNGLIGFGPEAGEFICLPDLDTFQVLPWDEECARVICDLYRLPDGEDDPGGPLPWDPRGNLKRVHREFEQEFGLRLRSGCEPEMSWFRDADSIERSTILPAHVFPTHHMTHLESVRPIVKAVTAYALAMGLDMEGADHEDHGQAEMNFAFDGCLETADQLVTFRQICGQVARELGVLATFMPKPLAGVMGNGCHHNLSLWRGEENVLLDAGARGPHLTELGRHALGGILEHSRGMTAIAACTANSYARFWDSGMFAPAVTNWGFDNRTCSVRVGRGRLEYKTPDASVNPYLSHAALLAAIADGIRRKLEPGPAEQRNSYDAAVADDASRYARLPRTLGEALDALEEDDVIRSAFSDGLLQVFVDYKRDEYDRSCGAVTDWHREMYLRALT